MNKLVKVGISMAIFGAGVGASIWVLKKIPFTRKMVWGA